MEFSISYALSTGSDISPKEKDRILKSVWKQIEEEGRVLRSRVEAQMNILDMDDITMIDGLDYAIVGVADYPHDCAIYDYVRCVEIFAVKYGLSFEDASSKVEEIIADNEQRDNGAIFVYPLDYIDEEELDEYDLLNAHEVVFKGTKDS